MKKYLCLIMALIFTLLSLNTYADKSEPIIPIMTKITEPTLPSTYVKDELCLMSQSQSLDDYLKELWTNKTTYVKIYDHFKIPTNEFFELYWKILHDNPEFFWVGSEITNARALSGNIYDFKITYDYTDPDVIAEKKAALDMATSDILMHITDDMSDFEKVMTVHDYMVLNYTYNTSDVMHSIFIMTEKVGVCMGYALTFNHLMNVLGIESTYVSSPPEYMNHAWNLVKIDGEWYHIDVTFDDPTYDKYASVRHTYALLSSDAIENAPTPHIGYDLGDLKADSTLYDNAPWRDSLGSIVQCNSKIYYISNNSVMDEDGNIIRKNLDVDGNGWNIYKDGIYNYTSPTAYTGLATYGNCIFYNTDKAIYSYDTTTKTETKILTELGVCGIFTDKNILKYSKYNMSTSSIEYAGEFVAKKEDGPVIGSSIHADGKIITPIYVEEDSHIIVFCHNNVHNQLFHIDGHGSFSVESETGDIFFWTDKLKPLSKKHHVE